MLYFRIFRASIDTDQLKRVNDLKMQIGRCMKPLLRAAVDATANVLGVRRENFRRSRTVQREFVATHRPALDGEIFTDGKTLIVFLVSEASSRVRVRQDVVVEHVSSDAKYRLDMAMIGPEWESEALNAAIETATSAMGASLSPYSYRSERFDELKAEGREPPAAPSAEETKASELLSDRFVRTLALAIKSSGGLLVRDLPKQLPTEARDRVEQITAALRDSLLIDSEIVVVCCKAQVQVTRAPNKEVLGELSAKGLKCACGRPLAEERIEEALAITDLGRALLDKARWLTVLLLKELQCARITPDAVLVEQSVGGDEIDCLANIDGELALFELKDKEFNLGNAYSFGAKIGIIRPEHPIIVTTERIGNDAKEHFVRARSAGARRDPRYVSYDSEDSQAEITYIEGLSNLRSGIEQLISAIYRKDAVNLLNRVIPVSAINGSDLILAIESNNRHCEDLANDQLPQLTGD